MNTEQNNNKPSDTAVKLLKRYAEENGLIVRSTSDLSPLEQWLILELHEKQSTPANNNKPMKTFLEILNDVAKENGKKIRLMSYEPELVEQAEIIYQDQFKQHPTPATSEAVVDLEKAAKNHVNKILGSSEQKVPYTLYSSELRKVYEGLFRHGYLFAQSIQQPEKKKSLSECKQALKECLQAFDKINAPDDMVSETLFNIYRDEMHAITKLLYRMQHPVTAVVLPDEMDINEKYNEPLENKEREGATWMLNEIRSLNAQAVDLVKFLRWCDEKRYTIISNDSVLVLMKEYITESNQK